MSIKNQNQKVELNPYLSQTTYDNVRQGKQSFLTCRKVVSPSQEKNLDYFLNLRQHRAPQNNKTETDLGNALGEIFPNNPFN